MRNLLILTTLLLHATSCQRLRPAGFWGGFMPQFCLANVSDAGPFGGTTAMYWKLTGGAVFSEKDLFAFASQNGWKYVDAIKVPADTVSTWVSGEPVFPFAYTDFTDDDITLTAFPRWIESEIVVHRFKTNWIAVEPGNVRETRVNGYIVLSSDKKQLSVYHLWGE